jgi:ligand-binding sensor domain-containing protein
MAGQPSAPEDHAATLLQAEPRSHDTVFMVRVQRRFRSWGLMVRSAERASRTMKARLWPASFETPALRAPQDEVRSVVKLRNYRVNSISSWLCAFFTAPANQLWLGASLAKHFV